MASLALGASISVLMRFPLPSIASTVNVGIRPPTFELPPRPGDGDAPQPPIESARREQNSNPPPRANQSFCPRGIQNCINPARPAPALGIALRREQRLANHFLDRRVAVEDGQQAGLPQRPHALLPGDVAQLLGG